MTRLKGISGVCSATWWLLPCVTVMVGCAQLPGFTKKKEFPLATPEQPAVDLVCVWQPAQGRGLNGLPTRGVSGELLFFTRHNPSPVVVEGDMRIYLFDDQGTAEERTKPIHIFDVPAVQLPRHLQAGSLGPTYQLFVPYPRRGPEQATCTVQVRFTSATGPVVFSQLSSITLPGTLDPTPSAAGGSVSQAGYLQSSDQGMEAAKRSTMPVRTISPRELAMAARVADAAASLGGLPDPASGGDLNGPARQQPASTAAVPAPQDGPNGVERRRFRLHSPPANVTPSSAAGAVVTPLIGVGTPSLRDTHPLLAEQ